MSMTFAQEMATLAYRAREVERNKKVTAMEAKFGAWAEFEVIPVAQTLINEKALLGDNEVFFDCPRPRGISRWTWWFDSDLHRNVSAYVASRIHDALGVRAYLCHSQRIILEW